MNKEFIANGKDIKQLPIRVLATIGNGESYTEENLNDIVIRIKNYIEKETAWNLFMGFKENGLCINGWNYENDSIGLRHDSDEYRAFDLVIIPDCSNYNQRQLESVVSGGNNITIPLYCLNSETIISNRAEFIFEELSEICAMRDKGYYA